jgi:hypothetical protein
MQCSTAALNAAAHDDCHLGPLAPCERKTGITAAGLHSICRALYTANLELTQCAFLLLLLLLLLLVCRVAARR